MAKAPKPVPFDNSLYIRVIKSFVGDFTVKVDRQKKLVTFKTKERDYVYTYDQLIDEAERMFND